MSLNQINMAIYAILLTNYYGIKLKLAKNTQEKKQLRIAYAQTLLGKLHISVNIINKEKLPQNGQFLLASNHRSVIDPLIIELLTKDTQLFGNWISKKELYNSLFFGLFVRNGGSVLLDRDSSQMGGFFSDIKEYVKQGQSIYIFPEGTRNKSEKPIGEFKEGARIIAIKNRIDILPVFIRSNANEALMSSLKDAKKDLTVDVEVGDVISYKDKSLPFEEAYKKQFHIA